MRTPSYSRQDRVPRRAQDRIEEAGGSAYAWYHRHLTAWLDPRGWATKVAMIVGALTIAAAGTCLAVLTTLHNPWAGAVSAMVLLAGAWNGRRRGTLPAWSTATAAVLNAGTSMSVSALVAMAAILAFLRLFAFARSRDVVFAAFAIASAVVLYGEPDLWRQWMALFTAAVTALLVAWWAAGRHVPLTFGRLTADHVAASPPPPPTRVPWPLRLWPPARRRMREVPKEIQKKKAGAYGERRTALILLALRRWKGTRIVHDVAIPGAKTANADHVVVARSGMFVIDSKQFGSRHDPGMVRRDTAGNLVHESGAGTRSLTQTVDTLRWATEALANTIGTPTRSVIAVHNAQVAPGLVVTGTDGGDVDVVAATALLSRIDGAQSVLSRARLSAARFRMLRLRSSETSQAPQVTAPLGSKIPVTPWAGAALSGPYRSSVRPDEASVVRDSLTDAESEDVSKAETPAVPDSALAHARNIPEASQERVMDGWEQMRVSERAAPDDVPPDLRGLQRGDRVEILEFRDGSMTTWQMVAMTGACQGAVVPYVWVAHLDHYRIHQQTGEPVFVATVSTEKIVHADRTQDGA